MENVKYENGKLTVSTPKGDIVISVEGDCDYPGVNIDFKSKEIKESAILFEDDTIQLARIEYGVEDEELRAYLWENPGDEEYSYKTTFNDALIFDENFEIIPYGTKVEYCGQIAYIVGDDRDNCPDGYCASLNYFIKYALEDETFDDMMARVESNNEPWYDIMDLWNMVKKVEEE